MKAIISPCCVTFSFPKTLPIHMHTVQKWKNKMDSIRKSEKIKKIFLKIKAEKNEKQMEKRFQEINMVAAKR